ncbi:hypothetical protein [Enterococcus faecalis]|uniref:hypothetical protein n=1 Tax=Enterococcus faecalis TaxID=1351 RepID=UPI002E341031|nr:hypothetical protein [Enterococcus faecalis]
MMFVGILGLLVALYGIGWMIVSAIKKKGLKNPLITFTVGFILFVFGISFSGNASDTNNTNSSEKETPTIRTTETKVKKEEKSVLKDYVSIAEKEGLPTNNIDDVILKQDTLIFEFAYNGQFGKYMQQLRKANTVDKRMQTVFNKLNAKKVQLKSDSGNIILSNQYGVDFIN